MKFIIATLSLIVLPCISLSADALCQNADTRWTEFQEELEWYAEFTKPVCNKMSADQNDLDVSFWKKWEESHLAKMEAIQAAKESFYNFREAISTCISYSRSDPLNGVGRSYGYWVHDKTAEEITHLITHYLEKNLFPIDWKEQFTKYKEAKVKN